MPLFFFPCRDPRRERANRERGKNAIASGFFFSGVFSYSPHGEHGEKGLFFKPQRQTATRAIAQHGTRRENKPIQARQTPRPNKAPPTAQTTRKRPKKGNRANAHGGRAGQTTDGRRERGAPSTEISPPHQPHRQPNRQPRPREGTAGELQGDILGQKKKDPRFSEGLLSAGGNCRWLLSRYIIKGFNFRHSLS